MFGNAAVQIQVQLLSTACYTHVKSYITSESTRIVRTSAKAGLRKMLCIGLLLYCEMHCVWRVVVPALYISSPPIDNI